MRTATTVADEPLDLDHDGLQEALTTRVGGRVGKDDADGGAEAGEGAEGSHHVNSAAGIHLAREVWKGGDASSRVASVSALPTSFVDNVLKEAMASKRKEKEAKALANDYRKVAAAVRHLRAPTVGDARARVEELRTRTSPDGRAHLNAKQFEAVSAVADRLISQLTGAAGVDVAGDEALRWVVHGGPGTGKSHVLKTIRDELFVGVMVD